MIELSDEGYLFSSQSSFAFLELDFRQTQTEIESSSTTTDTKNFSNAISGTWKTVTGRIPKSEIPRKNVWISFQVQNNSKHNRNWILYPESGMSNEHMVYYVQHANGVVETYHNGAGIPFLQRPVLTNYLAAPIIFEPNETVTVFVNIHSSFNTQNTFHILSEAEFQAAEIQHHLVLGVTSGTLLFAGIFSLLFFFALCSRIYLYYAIFCFVSAIHTLIVSGFITAVFSSTHGISLGRYTILTTSCMLISASLFSQHFLGLKRYPKRHFIFSSIIVLSLAALTTGFLPGLHIAWSAIQFIAAIATIVFIGTPLSLYRNRESIIFAIAWGIYAAGVILWLGATQGFVRPTFFNLYAPLNLQSLQITLLTLVLFWHIKKIDQARAISEIGASQSEKLKNLVRMLSHDLANLIWATKLHAQACKDDIADTLIVTESTDAIEKLCNNMSDLIESVRLIRALEDGKVQLTIVPVSLTEVLDNIRLSLDGRAKQANVTLEFENNLSSTTQVLADKVALTHNVLSNFITNAIKFSPAGKSVRIIIWQESNHVHISIKDRGIGIPQELLDIVFDPHKKSSRNGLRGEKGTGFGMPVAKYMLENFGGKLTIDSKTASSNSSPENNSGNKTNNTESDDHNNGTPETVNETGTTITIMLKACEA